MNLNVTLSEFLQSILVQEDQGKAPMGSVAVMTFLRQCGCDYYELLRIVSLIKNQKYNDEDIETIISLAPGDLQFVDLKNLDITTIRGMIPHWTATKYHTGPINQVVLDIQLKCSARNVGFHVYNSNLNPRKPYANDPYILLISTKMIRFIDINRHRTYQYLY